jgi:hypothetical protein
LAETKFDQLWRARIFRGGQFVTDFGLDKVAVGELQGAGIWPFGASIISALDPTSVAAATNAPVSEASN